MGSAPPSSRHQDGTHILMGDGGAIFSTESIDAGDQKSPMIGARVDDQRCRVGKKSPNGLWGALGGRGIKETIKQLNQ